VPTPLTFTNVSPEKWNEVKAKVQSEAGVTITSDVGEAEAQGVTFAWNYDGSSTLVITVENTSWYDPSEASIDQQIEAWMASLGQGSSPPPQASPSPTPSTG
jgi:hypothetical protein